MTAWRRARACLGQKAEDRRRLEFLRLENRTRKAWAELHGGREDWRQTLDQGSHTVLGRFRMWRTERSLRNLAGAVQDWAGLVEGWREEPNRDQKGERGPRRVRRTPTSGRQIERQARMGFRNGSGTRTARTVDSARPCRQVFRAEARSEYSSPTAPAPDPERDRGGFER